MRGFGGVMQLWGAGWFRRCAKLHGAVAHWFADLAKWFEDAAR